MSNAFSQCMTLEAVPVQIFKQLKGIDIAILKSLMYLFRRNSMGNYTVKNGVVPGLRHFADKFGVSYWQISRSLKRLKEAGLIDFFQRRCRNGEWRTNNFRIGQAVIKSVSSILNWHKKKRRHRSQGSANIVTTPTDSNKKEELLGGDEEKIELIKVNPNEETLEFGKLALREWIKSRD